MKGTEPGGKGGAPGRPVSRKPPGWNGAVGKKGHSDSAGSVSGAPLGVPEPQLFREGPEEKGQEGSSTGEARVEGTNRELKRLERILERVTLDLKKALEETARDPGLPPPPMPSVVVHKIEAPEIFPSIPGKGEGEDPGEASLPEEEFTLEEEAGKEALYSRVSEGEEPIHQPAPPPPEPVHLPSHGGGIFPAAGLLLVFLGIVGLLVAWNGIQGAQELKGKLEAQLKGARLTGGLLAEAEKKAREAKKLQEEVAARLKKLSARGKTLQDDLRKAMAWMSSFEARVGNLEKAGEDLKKALREASRAGKEAQASAGLSAKALARAETALSHLDEVSRAMTALAEIEGEGEILRARLAGDRLRNRLVSTGRKTWEPYPFPGSPQNKPETAFFPDFERGRALPKAIRNVIDGQTMVLVPSGKMIFGDEAGTGDPDEKPRGQDKSALVVEITKPFYVGRTEVTNARYQMFVASTGHTPPPYWGGKRCPVELLEFPVVCVSWKDARAYCEWAGLRLLTEAEWEYCAKSPVDGHSVGPWPWGKRPPDTSLANYDPTPPLRLKEKDWRFWLQPAGAKERGKTPWGLLQMAGNVAEWCRDWFRESWYTTLAERGGIIRDPQGPPFGLGKVIRGGSWCSSEGELRSSARQMASPGEKFTFLGFRCARDAQTVR